MSLLTHNLGFLLFLIYSLLSFQKNEKIGRSGGDGCWYRFFYTIRKLNQAVAVEYICKCAKFAIKFEIHRLSFSGYRAILAEPKNKASESSEQDYYSNMRQETLGHEPRVNMFSFGK